MKELKHKIRRVTRKQLKDFKQINDEISEALLRAVRLLGEIVY